jgi:hypothetical protein
MMTVIVEREQNQRACVESSTHVALRAYLRSERIRAREIVILLLLTCAGILVHGYHLGVEDQAIYLPSIKKNLDASLYPADSEFFLSQTKWTVFDEVVAFSARVIPLPLPVIVFAWHFAGILLFLLASLRLARLCFDSSAAQWGAVALLTALLTLPVAGTLALMVDQYLHPRVFATALMLYALVAILEGSAWSVAWIVAAAAIHPQVTFFAIGHLIFQAWRRPLPERIALAAGPLLPPTEISVNAWHEVMLTRRHHFPLQWTWYEWLGAYGPVTVLLWMAQRARRVGNEMVAHIAGRLAASCALGVVLAVMINVTPGLERFMPTQPMRQLHFVYVLMVLLAGGILGEMFLKHHKLRWAVVLLPVCGIMFWGQRQVFASSRHIEWPVVRPVNEWLLAFDWIRANTPKDSLFALDPRHMEQLGEDNHGFRALAERSMLADFTKDRGVAAIFPSIAEEWKRQVNARKDWRNFHREDFQHLRAEFGVTWVVLSRDGSSSAQNSTGMLCPYANSKVMVCRVE